MASSHWMHFFFFCFCSRNFFAFPLAYLCTKYDHKCIIIISTISDSTIFNAWIITSRYLPPPVTIYLLLSLKFLVWCLCSQLCFVDRIWMQFAHWPKLCLRLCESNKILLYFPSTIAIVKMRETSLRGVFVWMGIHFILIMFNSISQYRCTEWMNKAFQFDTISLFVRRCVGIAIKIEIKKQN